MHTENKFTHNDYEIVEREILYQGVFRLARYHVRMRLFNGGWSDVFTREVFERYSAAAVLPYDPVLDHVVLIEQFRPGSLADAKSPWLIEIPAGVLDSTETPEKVAIREAQEEAGCEVVDLVPIFSYFVSPGASNEYIDIYCARADASNIKGVHGLKTEHEDIRVINIPSTEAFAKLHTGEIKTPPAIIALQWLEMHRRKLQDVWL